ncbi:hypothetical protein PCANC_17167, partial [Puccinia coronata f. sp. avenae]
MSTASAPHRRRTTASGQRALPYVDGNRAWKRMACMTVSSFGTQFLWSAEMSQATPFLLSLGISKSRVALVLMAGPLSGLCVLVSLSTFAWCQEVAGIVAESGSQAHQNLSAFLAVVSFYALDGVQQVSNDRCATGGGATACECVCGAVQRGLGGADHAISLLDLPHLFKTTTSQLKLIAYIGGPVFVVSHLVMCVTVHEKRFVPGPAASSSGDAAAADDQARGAIWKAMSNMVTRFWEVWRSLDGTLVQPLCWIELWAWLGWFPLIFYSTTWIGDTWRRTSGETDDEQATRVGAIGLLVHSLLSLLGWILIPALVAHFRHRNTAEEATEADPSLTSGVLPNRLWCPTPPQPFCENSVPCLSSSSAPVGCPGLSRQVASGSVPVSRPNGEAASGHPMIPLQPLSSKQQQQQP